MSNYTQNVTGTSTAVSIAPPTGSVMAYLGTTIEPSSGWVICDGIKRTNTGGIYNNLIAAGIGTWDSSTYTPPDFRAAFLRGTGTNSIYGGYQGEGVGQVQGHVIAQHKHFVNIYYSAALSPGTVPVVIINGPDVSQIPGTGSISGTIGNGAILDNETRPFNFSVNWILKL